MSHFYLTLPSNSSMKYFPDNTLTRFVTKLHNDVSLSGDWEVELVDIMYPRNWYNVNEQYVDVALDLSVTIEPKIQPHENLSPNYRHRVPIPSGRYGTISELVSVLNTSIADTFKAPIPSWCSEVICRRLLSTFWPSFDYDPEKRSVKVTLPRGIYVNLSSKLAEIMGMDMETKFDSVRLFSGESIAASYRPCDIEGGLHTLYVYCDVLECIPVGDTMAPLLRIVEAYGSNGEETQKMTHIQYDQPRYFPVQKKAFDSIELDIRDDAGESIPFDTGQLIVTLNFRRAKDTYFVG